MKQKLSFFLIVTLFLSAITSISIAQTNIPKGKAQLIEFTNAKAKFTVPDGKIWYIYDVFASSDIKVKIKSLNGIELTNLSSNIIGPIFQSFNVPKIFPQNTNFELIILIWSQEQKKYILSENKAWINYIEIDN